MKQSFYLSARLPADANLEGRLFCLIRLCKRRHSRPAVRQGVESHPAYSVPNEVIHF